jgi:hypothetical protein
MTDEQDRAAVARAIIDGNLYMVLGTADQAGRPWVSPCTTPRRREFFWVSSPDARHSQNIVARPELSIVIFDSSVPIGTGQGLYMSGLAHELVGDERDRGGSTSSPGGRSSTADEPDTDVVSPARLRLYRAIAVEHYLLDADDRRVLVTP